MCPWVAWGALLSSRNVHLRCYADRKRWGTMAASLKLDLCSSCADGSPFLLPPPALHALPTAAAWCRQQLG